MRKKLFGYPNAENKKNRKKANVKQIVYLTITLLWTLSIEMYVNYKRGQAQNRKDLGYFHTVRFYGLFFFSR